MMRMMRRLLLLAAALACSCGAPRNELRFDLADPKLPDDTERTRVYQHSPTVMLAASRKALDERGFKVSPDHRTARGTWFTAELGGQAMGIDTSKGVGVLVRGLPDGSSRVSVVSRTTDTPAEVHVWIANALSTVAR